MLVKVFMDKLASHTQSHSTSYGNSVVTGGERSKVAVQVCKNMSMFVVTQTLPSRLKSNLRAFLLQVCLSLAELDCAVCVDESALMSRFGTFLAGATKKPDLMHSQHKHMLQHVVNHPNVRCLPQPPCIKLYCCM